MLNPKAIILVKISQAVRTMNFPPVTTRNSQHSTLVNDNNYNGLLHLR